MQNVRHWWKFAFCVYAPWLGLASYLVVVTAMPWLLTDAQGLVLLIPLSIPLALGWFLGLFGAFAIRANAKTWDVWEIWIGIAGSVAAMIIPAIHGLS